MLKKFLLAGNKDTGLLFLRVSIGMFMLFSHGLGKLKSFSENFHDFSNPIGLGDEASYLLTVLAEFFCSFLLVIGLWTRLAAIPLLITMFVAVFVIHIDDPWGRKEFGLLYAISYITILICGPGKYSLDYKLYSKI
jgi:putative oxidoreductase